MSAKVCLRAVKPEWKDATTLGQLELMIQSLYELGYEIDTPVTYLHDDDHVWLETVDDDDVVVYLKEPRVVNDLGIDERDAAWTDGGRYYYEWANGAWDRYDALGGSLVCRDTQTFQSFGPYTEVIE